MAEPQGIKCLSQLWKLDFSDDDWRKYLAFDPPVERSQITIRPEYSEVLLTYICRRTTWMWWEKRKLEPKRYKKNG